MKNIILIILSFSALFASSKNTFFVVNDSMSIDCADIIEISKPNKWGIQVMFNEKGKQKFYTIFKDNIGKDLALKVGDKVIFFKATISPSALEKGPPMPKSFGTGSLENAKLLKESFGNCK